MLAWSPDGSSMEMAVPWDSLWVLNPEGDTLRIQPGDDIRLRFQIEAGGDGVGKNFMPAGESGDKLEDGGGYYVLDPSMYQLGVGTSVGPGGGERGARALLGLGPELPGPV